MSETTKPNGVTGASYGATAGSDRRQRKLAAAFVSDPGYERLLELRRTDPRAFAKLGPAIRIGVGHYSAAKAAHQKEHDHDGDD